MLQSSTEQLASEGEGEGVLLTEVPGQTETEEKPPIPEYLEKVDVPDDVIMDVKKKYGFFKVCGRCSENAAPRCNQYYVLKVKN